MSEEADHSMVLQAKAGSVQAFGKLVDTHQQALRSFLRRLSGNRAEADDLAQEVFIIAWDNISRFSSGKSFRSWLFGIGYRRFLMANRSLFRQRQRDAAVAMAEENASTLSDIDQQLDLARAMESLPVDQRAVVALCLAAGCSHGEAAEALGLPLGTVKSHIQRGRARLLAVLGSNDG